MSFLSNMFMIWILCFAVLSYDLSGVSSASYDGDRLPKSVLLENYLLNIKTEIKGADDSTFSGTVKITVKSVEATQTIVLNAKDLNIDVATIVVTDVAADSKVEVDAGASGPVPKGDYFVVGLSSSTAADSNYTIEIPFDGKLSTPSYNYYVTSYENKDTKETSFFTATNFMPNLARQAFPCFDEPEFVSTFDIILVHDKKYKAYSNMPLKADSSETEGEWVTDHFETSLPMPTYSVGYSINDFAAEKVSLPSNAELEINILAPSDVIGHAKYLSEIMPKYFEYFEKFFSFPYKLTKFDVIAVSSLVDSHTTGIGLAFGNLGYILIDPSSISATSKKYANTLINEVIAQQWTQLRTFKWWDDLWLFLGTFFYAATLAVGDAFHGDAGLMQDLNSYLDASITADVNSDTKPLRNSVTDPQYATLFSYFAYTKNLIIFRMIAKTVGDDKLKEILSKFLQDSESGAVDKSDFSKFIGEEVGDTIKLPEGTSFEKFLDSWILQAGLPILTITRDYENKKVTINQKRFLLNKKDTENSCYIVPLSYTTGKDTNFDDTIPKDWLECDESKAIEKTIDIDVEATDWVIFNVQFAAYCRIVYDKENYKLLNSVLSGENFKNIHTLNRARLIDDSLALSWQGELEYSATLEMLEFLKKEDDTVVFKSLESSVTKLHNVLSQSPSFEKFQKYITDLLGPILTTLKGYDSEEDEAADVSSVKVFLKKFLCGYNAEDCVTKAKEYFKSWSEKKDDLEKGNPIPAGLRINMYGAGIRNGGDDEWNLLWDYFKVADQQNKDYTLNGFVETKDKEKLTELLDLAFSSETSDRQLTKSSTILAMTFAMSSYSDIGFPTARDYFYDNFEKISTFYEDKSKFCEILPYMFVRMTTEEERSKAQEFMGSHKTEFEACPEKAESYLQTVQINIDWISNRLADFEKYLGEK